MRRFAGQRGAALILLIGIVAALAILASTLVFVVANQQGATARVRSQKQSFYAAEAALDAGVRLAKVDKTMSTTSEWLTPTELAAAFAGAGFPTDAEVTYRVYDNLPTVDYNVKWDQGGATDASTPDSTMWVEATAKYKGKTTRARVLVRQFISPFAAALPKAVTYSDTGIRLNGNSDIYAVDESGNPDTSGPPYVTSITAGGTWLATMSSSWAEVGRFTANASSDLAGPGTTTQSLGIKVNGSVSMAGTVVSTPMSGSITAGGHTFDQVLIQPGCVGYLSDYFDQKAQSDLATESMAGETHAAAPTAPASWSPTGYTTLTSTELTTLESTSSTATYTATADLYVPTSLDTNLTLSRGTSTTGRTFNFRNLYVAGNLTLTGPVTVNATSLYVGGTITINNATTTTVTDTFGPLYVAGTGASSAAGRVNITTASAYTGGNFTVSNSTTTALTDAFGQLYVGGTLSVSGRVTVNAPTSVYAGTSFTITGPTTTPAVVDQFGLVYQNSTSGAVTFSNNVQVMATSTVVNGDFTISGATTPVKDWLGQIYVQARPFADPATGTVKWSGTASVTSRNYLTPDLDPLPMWMGRYWSRTGDYDDEYGPTWVPGNSSTSVVFNSTSASTIMCPLLCTTEKNTWGGNITYGSREKPMVFFYMCDNNGIYPQVCEYSGTGTYYGLMVINESTMNITNGVTGKPSIQGAIFAGCPYDPTNTSGLSMSDIVLNGNSTIAYDQSVVGAISTSSLKTTIMVTETVPGSWQELPVP